MLTCPQRAGLMRTGGKRGVEHGPGGFFLELCAQQGEDVYLRY